MNFLQFARPVQVGAVPKTSQDTSRENQERKEDRSQNDLHPEVDATVNKSPHTVSSVFDVVLHKTTSWKVFAETHSNFLKNHLNQSVLAVCSIFWT